MHPREMQVWPLLPGSQPNRSWTSRPIGQTSTSTKCSSLTRNEIGIWWRRWNWLARRTKAGRNPRRALVTKCEEFLRRGVSIAHRGPRDGSPVQSLCRVTRMDWATRSVTGGGAPADLRGGPPLSEARAPHALANLAVSPGRRSAVADAAALDIGRPQRASGSGGSYEAHAASCGLFERPNVERPK